MIIDQLSNLHKYVLLHTNLARALLFIEKTNLAALPVGKHILDGENLFVIVIEGNLSSEVQFESHQKYIDIHITLKGEDCIGWEAESGKGVYNADQDCALFLSKGVSWNTIPEHCFALYFPQDAHAPMKGEGFIKKVVFKVKINI